VLEFRWMAENRFNVSKNVLPSEDKLQKKSESEIPKESKPSSPKPYMPSLPFP